MLYVSFIYLLFISLYIIYVKSPHSNHSMAVSVTCSPRFVPGGVPPQEMCILVAELMRALVARVQGGAP